MEFYKNHTEEIDEYDKINVNNNYKRLARSIDTDYEPYLNYVDKDNYICCKCNKTDENNYGFFILQCGHLFHIKCIIDNIDIFKSSKPILEYMNNVSCWQCNKIITKNELLYVFNRYYDITIEKIVKYEKEIKELEMKYDCIKNELSVCYEYKHQLNNQIETTKHIVKTLTSII